MGRSETCDFGGVYAIRHVASGKLYIGSAVNFTKRWQAHRERLGKETHHSRHLQYAWNKYGADAFVFEIIRFVEARADLIPAEQQHLDDFRPYERDRGYNSSPTAGSLLGMKHSEATRANWSRLRKGKKRGPEARARMREAALRQSPEKRARIAEAHRGKVVSEETRAKLAAAFTGRSRPPEVMARLHVSNKGKKRTPEQRARIAAAKTGKKASVETRAKLSEAHKGQRPSPEAKLKRAAAVERLYKDPEYRAKLSAAQKGKPKSPEHRAKLSAAQKGKPKSPEHRAKIAEANRSRAAARKRQGPASQMTFAFGD